MHGNNFCYRLIWSRYFNCIRTIRERRIQCSRYGYVKLIINDGIEERVWDEEKITQLLEQYKQSHLFISGCYSNQGKFYKHFDYVVLLKADLNVMLDRINKRTSHNYGKSPEERAEVLDSFENVLPLLAKSSDIIIDTTHNGINEVCRKLKELV